MGSWLRLAVVAAAVVLLGGCSGSESVTRPVETNDGSDTSPLLLPAAGGDGDSWHDTGGREYRLGLVNAPEYDECYGSEATAKRQELTAHGFRADVYTQDVYGRGVAVVTTSTGINVNIYLARHGFANDKYLSQYRHENPSLAARLDEAFTEARSEGKGLWSACSGTIGQGSAGVHAGGSP